MLDPSLINSAIKRTTQLKHSLSSLINTFYTPSFAWEAPKTCLNFSEMKAWKDLNQKVLQKSTKSVHKYH